MKKIATFIMLLLTLQAFSQQEAQFSQNMFTKLTVNPAAAGTNKAYCGTLLYRSQWVSFPGSPKTAMLNLDAYLENISSGIGLTVMNDRLGFENNFLARVSYARMWEMNNGTFSIGAEGGVMQKSLGGNWIPPQSANDAAIPAPSISAMSYDAGAGLYYTSEAFYCGISATQLPQAKFKSGPVEITNVRHYYVQAGWNWEPVPEWRITPSVFVKSDAATAQLDVNVLAEFRDQVWGGASYRLTDAVVLMAGMKRGNWKFGYAYDINTSSLNSYNSNGHEIVLGYCFKPVNIICNGHENPRFPSFKSPCE
jgi:type IX secretion system PorP/SprF family membrane protein